MPNEHPHTARSNILPSSDEYLEQYAEPGAPPGAGTAPGPMGSNVLRAVSEGSCTNGAGCSLRPRTCNRSGHSRHRSPGTESRIYPRGWDHWMPATVATQPGPVLGS